MTDAEETLVAGLTLTLEPTAMAHGGESIAHAPDGRVVFIQGAIPGDVADVKLTKVKKRWARGEAITLTHASPDRVEPACPAAAAGAGCCDYAHIAPSVQARYKREVLVGQLDTHAKTAGVLTGFDLAIDLEEEPLAPARGWRTRVRLGVDDDGRAGMRKSRSHEVVTDTTCSQTVPGMLGGIVGEGAAAFTPGAELVVVLDSEGRRHVVETFKPQRGKRIEHVEHVIEGPGHVVERVTVPRAGSGETPDDVEFVFPPTAFWQAHRAAPERYSRYIADWGADSYTRQSGWDLYGGVGLFVPSISAAMDTPYVHSVDYSDAATRGVQECLAGLEVSVRNQKVEAVIPDLPDPGLVVLDPPRTGAGETVVAAIAARAPERVIHIGCDPATFARDLSSWGNAGYRVERMALVDAFPGTHHFEVLTSLIPVHEN